MQVLDKNFQIIGGIGVCCFPEHGEDMLQKCTNHVRLHGILPQVVYLKSETPSDKKWLGGNTEKFYYNGRNIVEVDENDLM
ncbi:hypothetical protein [Helicobacter didelphidarum]|nr:hypothetical protein [Helicobacter didelphidarum]